ncbi:hypothetical protein BKA69DRAFT_1040602 [Paraphysoderma sedebokerense]|nr:hypothetical protein BKA69DRAFT_1040602 [Paraphysoderma sedebokerense]
MTGEDNVGVKIESPGDQQQFNGCLGTSPGTPAASASPGRPFTVSWNITIPHENPPGVTLSMRCAGAQDFQPLATGIDINAKSATVNIPADANGACEMQWRWTSTEDGGSYIECADINIIRSAAGAAEGEMA